MKKIVLLVAVMMSVAVVSSAQSKIEKEVIPTMKPEPVQNGPHTIPPIIIR